MSSIFGNNDILSNISNLNTEDFINAPSITEMNTSFFSNLINTTDNLIDNFNIPFNNIDMNNNIDEIKNVEWEPKNIVYQPLANNKVLYNNLISSPINKSKKYDIKKFFISKKRIKVIKKDKFSHQLKISYQEKNFKEILEDKIKNMEISNKL